MYTYDIFSDSSCDLPKTIIDEHQIKLIPFYITFDQEIFLKENEEIIKEDFYNKLSDKSIFSKTSMPSVADYIDRFEQSLKEGIDILCFTLNKNFSGSYQSAVTANELLLEKYPDRNITIIDTGQATAGQGLIVYQAIKMRKSGLTLEETSEKIDEIKCSTHVLFTVDNLEHLYKGGRVSKLTSVAGNMLSIKPIIHYHYTKVQLLANVRGRKKSLQKMIDYVKNYFTENNKSYNDYDFVVGDLMRVDDLQYLKELLEEEIERVLTIPNCKIGATIGTNTGPSAIGLAFIKKFVTT